MRHLIDAILDVKNQIIMGGIIALIFLNGCAVTEGRYSHDQYVYTCELPQWWIDKVDNQFGHIVLPWKEYRRTAFSLGVSPDSEAFYYAKTNDIYYKDTRTPHKQLHETAHSYDNWNGLGLKESHPKECWAV